jgi:hypothetical protein
MTDHVMRFSAIGSNIMFSLTMFTMAFSGKSFQLLEYP